MSSASGSMCTENLPAKLTDQIPAKSSRPICGMRLAKWLGLAVTADNVVNLRLALMALLPNVSGLVLAFALALRKP
jgi:hypothetical protein